MAKKKLRKCVRCEQKTEELAVACESCYEEMRKAMLDEIAKRDLIIVGLNTQVSLLQTAVKLRAEAMAAQTEEKRKTA